MLCELGQPDWADASGAHLVYWSHESSSALFFWLIVDEEVVVFGKNRFLALDFDEHGIMRTLHEEERSFTKNMDRPDGRPTDEEFAALFRAR